MPYPTNDYKQAIKQFADRNQTYQSEHASDLAAARLETLEWRKYTQGKEAAFQDGVYEDLTIVEDLTA